MSDVYLAYDTKKKKLMALKLIEQRDDRDTRDAIKAEGDGVKLQQALSASDPAVPKVEDFGTVDGFFYIAMEYVEGTDLSELIERKLLAPSEVIRIGAGVCRTLQIAHTLMTTIDGRVITQIVHGDIKPKNIRLTNDGTVRLLDFGIAKALSLTRKVTHNEYGTLDYCSPERLDTGRLDAQSDLWSLGVMLYEMVSGRLPFQAETPRAQEALIMSGQSPPPLPPDCPKALTDIIAKALDPEASRRYQSAGEILKDLQDLLQAPTRRIGSEDGDRVGGGGEKDPTESHHVEVDDASRAAGKRRGGDTDGGGRGRRFRLASLLFKAAVTIVLSVAMVLGAAEWIAWRAKRELHDDLSNVTFLRLADSEGFWTRYKAMADKGVLKLGLPELQARMKLKLSNVAQRVIKDYAKDRPTARESDWLEARTILARVLEIDNGDASAKSMMLYCEGQIERINGDAQKTRKKVQEAATRFNKAVRLFTDAAELQPQWPDPHLGLAVVYAYGAADADRAVEELDRAKALGLSLGDREVAMRADCLRLKADAQYDELKQTPGARADDYRNVKQQYARALEKYRQVLNFSDRPRKQVREIEERMQKLDAAIEKLERPASVAPTEVKPL